MLLQVRNRLDGRFYAIKRIQLNTKSRQFTKKITREVKLLSRLNHEGVVRYYNSWIEISTEAVPSESSTEVTSTDTKSDSRPSIKSSLTDLRNSLGFSDDIEKLAPAPTDGSVDWSVSNNQHDPDDESDDEDDDDDDLQTDVFGASFL